MLSPEQVVSSYDAMKETLVDSGLYNLGIDDLGELFEGFAKCFPVGPVQFGMRQLRDEAYSRARKGNTGHAFNPRPNAPRWPLGWEKFVDEALKRARQNQKKAP